jgi:hypothetical protein
VLERIKTIEGKFCDFFARCPYAKYATFILGHVLFIKELMG